MNTQTKQPAKEEVVSLELAKTLAELGLDQHRENAWCLRHVSWILCTYESADHAIEEGSYATLTVPELRELLPAGCETAVLKYDAQHACVLGDRKFYADTEADAMAKMLANLAEDKIITL